MFERNVQPARRFIAALLVVALLMSLAGCSLVDKIQSKIDPTSNKTSAPELVRLLVSSVNDYDKLTESFEAIPSSQRENITFSYFAEYISILSDFSNDHGKITKFHFLNDEDNKEHLDKIYNKICQNAPTGNFESVFKPYGSVKTVQLDYEKDDYSSYIYLSLDSNGSAYLSYDWVMNSISIYNYIEHYFYMLDDKNADGIAVLYKNKAGMEIYSDEIIKAKADYAISFYDKKVKSTSEQYRICSLNAFYIDYEIPEVFSSSSDKPNYSRHVYAFRKDSGTIDLIDDIPQEIGLSVISLLVSQNQTFRCGVEYDYPAVQRVFGRPLNVRVEDIESYTAETADGNELEKKRLTLQYKGILLVFEAYYNDDSDWYGGELVKIMLVKNSEVSYSLSDIQLGDPEDKILMKFPMIDYGEYELIYQGSSNDYMLNYEVEDGVVVSATIEKIS